MREPANCTFEGVSVDRRRLTVERDGAPVDLEPKALDVLLFLIDHRDRLVTKDELLDVVWKDTFVTPNVLTRAIAQIRKGLGDDAERPRIVETVAKRGYRFIAAVQGAEVSSPTPAEAVRTEPAIVGTEIQSRGRSRRRPIIAVAGILIAVAVVFGVLKSSDSAKDAGVGVSHQPQTRQLTTRAGFNGQPTVSPDGRSVAYVSDRSGSLEIYITGLLATGSELALTSNGGQNMHPDWSPDGHWIAFDSRKLGGIWAVPSSGGTPQRVAATGSNPSWAPDSDRIVFTSNSGGFIERATLWTVKRDGSDLRQLLKIEQSPGGANAPVWSHNGKFVAFVNQFGGVATKQGIYLIRVEDNSVHAVAAGAFQGEPRFSPSDDAIYWVGFGANVEFGMRRIAIDPSTGLPRGNIETVMPVNGLFGGLSISRSGVSAYGAITDEDNLWAVDVDENGARGEPIRLTNDSVRNNRPDYSPSGKLAFIKFVPGQGPSVWLMNGDGTNAEVLLPGVGMRSPFWSHDGARIFATQKEQTVWVDIATRATTKIPIRIEDSQFQFPNLSPDDRAVAYHRIESDGEMSIWLATFDGKPERKLVTDPHGVGFPIFSPDGKQLAVEIVRGDNTFIGLVSSDGTGPIRELVTDEGNSWPHSWSPDGRRIAYAGQRAGVWNVWEVNVATKVSRQLTHFTLPIGYVRYPSWSPDGKRIVFERAISSSTIWTTTIK